MKILINFERQSLDRKKVVAAFLLFHQPLKKAVLIRGCGGFKQQSKTDHEKILWI